MRKKNLPSLFNPNKIQTQTNTECIQGIRAVNLNNLKFKFTFQLKTINQSQYLTPYCYIVALARISKSIFLETSIIYKYGQMTTLSSNGCDMNK